MKDKVVIVTGGSSGIGKALVDRLLAEGAMCYTISRPSAHYAEARGAWGERMTGRALEGDVTVEADLARLVAQVEQHHGRLDLLINNAGAYFQGDGGLPAPEVLEANWAVNLLGPYRLIRLAVPLLERAAAPIVVNVSSGAGAIGAVNGPGPLGYRTSKAALNMLTRSLAFELAPRNIAVHAVDPGYIRTRLNPDGTGRPEDAVAGMWATLGLHDLNQTGLFWLGGQPLAW